MPAHDLNEPTHAMISDCAYFHWLNEGSVQGHDREDWLAAEKQLVQAQFVAQGIAWVRGTAYLPHGYLWEKIRV